MDITATLDRLRSEAVYLNDCIADIVERGDTSPEAKAAFDEGVWLRDALIAEGIELEARRSAVLEIEDVVRNEPVSVERGDGGGVERGAPVFHRDVDPYDEDTIRSIGVSEAFKRAVGETRKVGADAQQELERKGVLASADPEHMGGFREYVLHLGSDDYARGWFKRSMGNAHLMTDAERYAEERAARFLSQRAVGIGSDAAGAALIPVHLDPTVILTNAGAKNPFRQISRTVSIMQNVWNGVSSAGVSFVASTEGGDTADGAPTFADPSITCAKAHCTVPISFEAYDDIANIGEVVASMFADAKDRFENAAFATGTGTNEPIGIVTAINAAGVGRHDLHDTNSAFTADDLLDAQNALGARYQDNASWLASLTWHNRVRKLGDTNYYGRSVTLPEGASDSWLGKPAYEASGMTTLLSTATNNAIVYGDFSNYVIVDRVGMAVEFVPHLFSTGNGLPNGKRAWHAWYRVGADSVNDSGFVLSINPAAA